MIMAKNNKTFQDFDPNAYLKTDDYQKDIKDLGSRIKKLEDQFGSNEKIADTLCETAEKATKMQQMLADSFLKQLQHNPEVKGAVNKIIDESDRNAFQTLAKKMGVGAWSIVVFLAGVVVTALVGNILKK